MRKLLLFFTFTFSVLSYAKEVNGVVIKVNRDEREIVLKMDQEEQLFKVSNGDANYLKPEMEIRGVSVKSAGNRLLEKIWPNGRMTERILTDTNRILRQESELMGRKVFRSLKDPMPTFALYDHRGDLIQSSMLHNKITLLNFIFTRCRVPTMCPAATERMKELLEKCKQAGVENIQVYSITLDPQYDSPGILNDYATNKGVTDEDFHFLTGPVRVIEDLKKHHGIETKDDETYGIYHTMMTVIIDPMKKVHYQIPGSHWSAEDYLNRILKLAQIEK